MNRLSPYLFFVLAAGALVLVAVQGDAALDEPVEPVRAVLVMAGAFAAAHALRYLVARLRGRERADRE